MPISPKSKKYDQNIEAELDYAIAAKGNRIILKPSVPGGKSGRREGQFERRTVKIVNARPLIGTLSVDVEGFDLVRSVTKVSNFYDDMQISEIYDLECEKLVQQLTGCSRAVVFDHTKRCDDKTERERLMVREPVQGVHNDYTEVSAAQRVKDIMGVEANELLAHQFSIVNVWRSIKGAIETMPLAICDAQSVSTNDLIVAERRSKERTGFTFRLAFNALHKWFYFPKMRFEEVLMIKSYDTRDDGTARFTPHTAFVDPLTKKDARPRQSIETRVFAFH